jgi:hypothetical protein
MTRASLADWNRNRGMGRVEPVRESAVRARATRIAHTEEDHAIALIQWRDLYKRNYPQLGLLIHIPMGGWRDPGEAGRLKAMGARAGVSDYLLACPTLGDTTVTITSTNAPPTVGACKMMMHGLWLELKSDTGRLDNDQADWGKLMLGQGYEFKVAHGWIEAARMICGYLGIERIAP